MWRELFWKPVAWLLARPAVVDALIERAVKTPYSHIYKDAGVYMERYWLFNPYELHKPDGKSGWRRFFPSIRLHKICLPDVDRHMHDHPWDARTIILRGMYIEQRMEQSETELGMHLFEHWYRRDAGDTARVLFGQYHRITTISKGGVWTMFITWKYRGTWGYNVEGKKVHWKEYHGINH